MAGEFRHRSKIGMVASPVGRFGVVVFLPKHIGFDGGGGGVMQLQWEGEGDEWEAKTPFGKYHIARDLFMHGLAWSYCFADRHDEGDFPAASVEEAKTRANEHWQDRIAPIIAPYVDKA